MYLPEQALSRITSTVYLRCNVLDHTPTRLLPFPVASSLDHLPNTVPALKFLTQVCSRRTQMLGKDEVIRGNKGK